MLLQARQILITKITNSKGPGQQINFEGVLDFSVEEMEELSYALYTMSQGFKEQRAQLEKELNYQPETIPIKYVN